VAVGYSMVVVHGLVLASFMTCAAGTMRHQEVPQTQIVDQATTMLIMISLHAPAIPLAPSAKRFAKRAAVLLLS